MENRAIPAELPGEDLPKHPLSDPYSIRPMCTPKYAWVSHSGSRVPLGQYLGQYGTFCEPANFFGPIVSVRSTSPIGLYNDARGTLLYQICRNLSGQSFNRIGYLYNYTLGSFPKTRRTHYNGEYIEHHGCFWLYLPTIYPNYPWSGTKPHDNLENFDIKGTV